jgi:hypothetical protein
MTGAPSDMTQTPASDLRLRKVFGTIPGKVRKVLENPTKSARQVSGNFAGQTPHTPMGASRPYRLRVGSLAPL